MTYFYHDGANVVAEYAESTAGGQPGDALRYYVHGTNGIDERAVMHEMNLADLGYQGQDHYYLLRELDTVVGLANENGRLEEGYGYDAYGLMAGYNFLPSDFNADGNVDLEDFGVYALAANSDPTINPLTDLNDDGKTNLLDFGLFALEYGSPPASIDDSHEGNRYHFTARPMYYLPIRDGETITHELRLAHHRARWLDLLHGRWLQRDPALYVDGMNLYEYARNAPTRFLDPNGTCPVSQSGEVNWGQVSLRVSDRYFKKRLGKYLAAEIVVGGRVAPRFLKDPCCSEIGVVQIVHEKYQLTAWGPWEIDDHGPGRPPWYAYSDPRPPAAVFNFGMNDDPGYPPWQQKIDFSQEFETCVVCASKELYGKYKFSCILGCITWGHYWELTPTGKSWTVKLCIGEQCQPPAWGGAPPNTPRYPELIHKPLSRYPTSDFITTTKRYRY